jgi:hypothetical protein
MRSGGATRRLWRIPDGKSESGLFSCLELRGGSLHPSQLRTDRLALMSKFDYVLTHARFMEPCRPSTFYNYLVEP